MRKFINLIISTLKFLSTVSFSHVRFYVMGILTFYLHVYIFSRKLQWLMSILLQIAWSSMWPKHISLANEWDVINKTINVVRTGKSYGVKNALYVDMFIILIIMRFSYRSSSSSSTKYSDINSSNYSGGKAGNRDADYDTNRDNGGNWTYRSQWSAWIRLQRRMTTKPSIKTEFSFT